jgi:hypothetical protein
MKDINCRALNVDPICSLCERKTIAVASCWISGYYNWFIGLKDETSINLLNHYASSGMFDYTIPYLLITIELFYPKYLPNLQKVLMLR